MMIDRHTLTPIGILAVHFGSHDIAAAGDAVQKSSCRKFTQIGNDKRATRPHGFQVSEYANRAVSNLCGRCGLIFAEESSA